MRPEERTGLDALIPQAEAVTLDLVLVDDRPVLGPPLGIDLAVDRIGRRSGRQNIHHQTLVEPVYGEIHLPPVFGTPMPVEDVLPVAIPRPLDAAPQRIDTLCERLLALVALREILMRGQQPLHQKGRLHQIASVVLLAEGFHAARPALDPMRPGAVEAVGTFEERDDAFEAFDPLFTGDVAALHTGDKRQNTEAAAARRHDRLVVFGIDAVHVDPFARKAAVGLGARPEIIERTPLDTVQQRLVRKRRCGTLRAARDDARQSERRHGRRNPFDRLHAAKVISG